jgi:hypothetical protein
MKIPVNIEAETTSGQALSKGKVAVNVEGIALADLVDAVNGKGCLLVIAEEPGRLIVEPPPRPLMPLMPIDWLLDFTALD